MFAFKFTLSGPGANNANGWIVQEVQGNSIAHGCGPKGKTAHSNPTYYEGWQVKNRNVFKGLATWGYKDFKVTDWFRACPALGRRVPGISVVLYCFCQAESIKRMKNRGGSSRKSTPPRTSRSIVDRAQDCKPARQARPACRPQAATRRPAGTRTRRKKPNIASRGNGTAAPSAELFFAELCFINGTRKRPQMSCIVFSAIFMSVLDVGIDDKPLPGDEKPVLGAAPSNCGRWRGISTSGLRDRQAWVDAFLAKRAASPLRSGSRANNRCHRRRNTSSYGMPKRECGLRLRGHVGDIDVLAMSRTASCWPRPARTGPYAFGTATAGRASPIERGGHC